MLDAIDNHVLEAMPTSDEDLDVFCQALFPEKSVEFPCFHQGIFPAFGGY